ncbi:MAG: hypothetical protein KJO07_18585 [Deltaproteobacteria bacterium]|nr:hypothetical protein [Deltaproteobacteria bacterium]
MNRRKLGRPGGTSIAEEEGSTTKWLAAAVGIGVLIVVVFMVAGGEGEKQAAQSEQSKAKAQKPATERQAVANDPEPIPEISDRESASMAASALESDLQAKRLWSAVELDPGQESVLILRTAFCGEAGLKSSIDKLAGRLKTGGVTKIECFTRHGTLEFERSL